MLITVIEVCLIINSESTQSTVTNIQLTFPKALAHYVAVQYAASKTIVEFGTGGSTVLASRMDTTTIYAVESDKDWLSDVLNEIDAVAGPGTVIPVPVDIGPTIEWGRPKDLSQIRRFPNYAISPFMKHVTARSPDTVLIDGRFRVACFVATLAFIKAKCTIIFDDYLDRENYHVVERFLVPDHYVDRAAVFQANIGLISPDEVLEFFDWFFVAH